MIAWVLASTLVFVQGQVSSLQPAQTHHIESKGLGVETTLSSRLSLMVAARKETSYFPDGWMGNVSLAWRGSIGQGWNGRVHLGLDGGLASHQYNRFSFQADQGELRYQRWEFVDQNAGVLTLGPVVGVSASHIIVGPISVRPDFSLRWMHCGVKEAGTAGTGPFRVLRDDLFWKPVPTFSILVAF